MDTIDTASDAGRQVKELRTRRGLTQGQLAAEAGVSRKFVAEFEAGHDRAELGKALQLMQAAGCSLRSTPEPEPVPSPLQALIDEAARTIRRELGKGDPEFALRILGNTVTAIVSCEHPGRLRKPPNLKEAKWDKLLAAAIGYALRLAGVTRPAWTNTAPLATEWFPYDFRTTTGAYLALTKRETPPELARVGIFLRARSLTSA
ncbi:helix-turn-helix domain-containing protein [Arthrobacter sp. H41]|uniref:helix-turn-helix domain-containing protein n=1 Tax=Arthrobacter sp. H41 TaxID=1312978 RepID=UPI0004B07FD9|nr:helix-turn-helix domain-containing protein [Arthrobacter sp. H41]